METVLVLLQQQHIQRTVRLGEKRIKQDKRQDKKFESEHGSNVKHQKLSQSLKVIPVCFC